MSTERPDSPELPDVRQALLTPDDVHALFHDVETLTTNPNAFLRPPAPGAPTRRISLREAKEHVLAASQPVQLRYRHDGGEWWDTLQPTPNGTQLVRIRHPLG